MEKEKKRVLGITDQTCETFPFARTSENNAEQISIRNVTLGSIDPWFFQENKHVTDISFEGSELDLSPFDGHTFAAGCDNIKFVSFKNTKGITLDDFIRRFASKTLLERVLARECKLIFSPEDTGATMMHFLTKDKEPVVTQEAIHLLIRSSGILTELSKKPETQSKTWLNTLTFGLLGS